MLKRESCASILLAPRPPSRSPPTYDPHSTRCTAGCHTSRDFVHWRFLDAGELSLRTVSLWTASVIDGVQKPEQEATWGLSALVG
jgi:hypothetical protein